MKITGKKNRMAGLLLGGILTLTLFAGCGSEETGGPDTTSLEQCSLASFTAQTMDGGAYTQDDIQNKDVTIINFWGTTCGPCIAEMPDLAEYEKTLPDNVALVTVCLDWSRKGDVAAEIMEEAGYEGITLFGGDGDYGKICSVVRWMPTTIFVDSEGNQVGEAIIGGQTELAAVYTERVNQVLKEAGKAEIELEK